MLNEASELMAASVYLVRRSKEGDGEGSPILKDRLGPGPRVLRCLTHATPLPAFGLRFSHC